MRKKIMYYLVFLFLSSWAFFYSTVQAQKELLQEVGTYARKGTQLTAGGGLIALSYYAGWGSMKCLTSDPKSLAKNTPDSIAPAIFLTHLGVGTLSGSVLGLLSLTSGALGLILFWKGLH